MKSAINLLPPQPEAPAGQTKQKKIVRASGLLLAVFLIINLLIFGFSLLLIKNTADTRGAVKREEERIASFAPTEKLYRALSAKLSFLTQTWQKKIKPEEVVNFSQALLIPELKLEKISLKQDGLTVLSLKATNSDILENFLNGLNQPEKSRPINNLKVVSTEREKEGGYKFDLSFVFKGEK